MISLVVTICMIDQPSRCKDLMNQVEMSRKACEGGMGMMAMPEMIAPFPNWRIARWKCVDPEKKEQEI